VRKKKSDANPTLSKGENSITIIGYWLKSVTVTRIVGWSKSRTGSGDRLIGWYPILQTGN
jgi:hypothetical protein